jgi:hypothetical protein
MCCRFSHQHSAIGRLCHIAAHLKAAAVLVGGTFALVSCIESYSAALKRTATPHGCSQLSWITSPADASPAWLHRTILCAMFKIAALAVEGQHNVDRILGTVLVYLAECPEMRPFDTAVTKYYHEDDVSENASSKHRSDVWACSIMWRPTCPRVGISRARWSFLASVLYGGAWMGLFCAMATAGRVLADCGAGDGGVLVAMPPGCSASGRRVAALLHVGRMPTRAAGKARCSPVPLVTPP